MARRPAPITQTELTCYAKAMQDSGVPVWSVQVEKPDGTRITIKAGDIAHGSNASAIDNMLGINK